MNSLLLRLFGDLFVVVMVAVFILIGLVGLAVLAALYLRTA